MVFSLDQSNPLMKKQLFIHHWLLGGLTLFRLHTRRVTPLKVCPTTVPILICFSYEETQRQSISILTIMATYQKKNPKTFSFSLKCMSYILLPPSCFVCPSFQFRMSKYIVCYEKLIDTISITFLTYLYLKSQYSHRFIIA